MSVKDGLRDLMKFIRQMNKLDLVRHHPNVIDQRYVREKGGKYQL